MDDDELLHCTSEEDIEMASLIAHRYGCKLEVIDLHKDYGTMWWIIPSVK
jgi:tRNA-specific 2-thiouridylase